MSERGNFRGRGGGRGDRGGRTDRGGRGGSSGGGQSTEKKKENILDLTKYIDKEITVKFNGGREGRIMPAINSEQLKLTICSQRHAQRLRPINESCA